MPYSYRLVVLVALMLSAQVLYSAEFTASDAAELTAAINTANGNGVADTITLVASTTYTFSTIDNTTDGENGLPSITSDITITGNGATIERSASAVDDYRLFHVGATGTLTLSDLTVTRGIEVLGGAIYVALGGTLTLDEAIVQNSRAAAGGGIYNLGTLVIDRSTIDNNDARTDITGLSGDDVATAGTRSGAGGGIFHFSGTLTITNSTISNNDAFGDNGRNSSADAAGGGGGGGAGVGGGICILSGAGNVELTNCTISTNDAIGGNGGDGTSDNTESTGASGGGAGGFGGAGGDGKLVTGGADDGDDAVVNGAGGGGAVLNNGDGGDAGFGAGSGGGSGTGTAGTAGTYGGAGGAGGGADGGGGGGGGAGLGGGIFADAGTTVTLEHCTLTLNTASAGAGGSGDGTGSDGSIGEGLGGGVFAEGASFEISHTIIGDNTATDTDFLDVSDGLTSNGYNIVEDLGMATITLWDPVPGGTDQETPPQLDVLANYGGPTKTHSLQAASPAIDAGDTLAGLGGTPTTDQRGLTREFNGAVDVGAYEDTGTNVAPTLDLPGAPGVTDFAASSDFTLAAHQGDDFDGAVDADLEATDADGADTITVTTTFVSGPGGVLDTLDGVADPVVAPGVSPLTVSWTGTIATTATDGTYTWTVELDDGVNIAVSYTVEIVVSNTAPLLELSIPSDFSASADFEVSLDPGDDLDAMDIDLDVTDADLDALTVTVTFASGPGSETSLAGVTAPTGGATPSGMTISWTGAITASNAPGTYEWTVLVDDGIAAAVSYDVQINVNNLPPTHAAGVDANDGDGLTQGAAYSGGLETGDDENTSLLLAAASDPNTSQSVTLDSVTDGVGNPSGGTGFDITLSGTDIVATPAGTLVFPEDEGIYAYRVRISDGTDTTDLFIAVEVSEGPVPRISVFEGELLGLTIVNGSLPPVNPDLSVRNFGDHGLGAGLSDPAIIGIENTGTGPLTLGDPIVTGEDADSFIIDLDGYSNELPVGGTTTFRIRFDPEAWPLGLGTKSTTVRFSHDGNNSTSPFEFGITGKGVGSASGSDSSSFTLCSLNTRAQTSSQLGWLVLLVGCIAFLSIRSRRRSQE